MDVGRQLVFSTSGFNPAHPYGIDTCLISLADPRDVGIAVVIALLSYVGKEKIAFPLPLPVC